MIYYSRKTLIFETLNFEAWPKSLSRPVRTAKIAPQNFVATPIDSSSARLTWTTTDFNTEGRLIENFDLVVSHNNRKISTFSSKINVQNGVTKNPNQYIYILTGLIPEMNYMIKMASVIPNEQYSDIAITTLQMLRLPIQRITAIETGSDYIS